MAAEVTADSPEVAALKELLAQVNAEKALATAQLDKLKAEKELAAALAPPDAAAQVAAQVAAEKAQAEAQKALADAQKAVFDQQKSAAEAQAAAIAAEQTALKAKFGTVAGSQATTGAVEIGEGAGNGEASMLAAKAVENAAERIAGAIATLGEGKHYVIYAGQQKPTFGRWNAFRVQIEIAKDSFARAEFAKSQADEIATPPQLTQSRAGAESVGTFITGAGAVLDLGAKLGSYFQSDYKVMGATVAGSDDDLLAVTVAGKLTNSWYPARWVPQTAVEPITELLKPLAAMRERSVIDLEAVQEHLATYQAEAEKTKDAQEKQTLGAVVAAYQRAAEAYAAAQKRFDDLLASLAAVTDGVPLAVHIVEEKTVSDKLAAGSRLVFLRLNTPAGGRYTKKSLWTFFGTMPFYVSGGAIASYVVVEPNEGGVLTAGQFTVHSGYHKLHKAAEQFK